MTRAEQERIARAIAQAEDGTSGRIGVRVIPDGTVNALERAHREFKGIGFDRHDAENAALILVAPKARQFAVIGDRALHERVGDAFWNEVVEESRPYFQRDEIAGGVVHAVERLGAALKANFTCE